MQKFIPTCFNSLGKKLFVAQNHPKASDLNPGTVDMPFKTISQAAGIMGKYDEVIINEGIYREEILLKVNGHHYTPELLPIFRAVEGKMVFIKGSDIFSPEWRAKGRKFSGLLPEQLLEPESYNPYAEGTGRLFVDDKELFQGRDWNLSENGKEIIIDFNPKGHVFELTVRKRCIKSEFDGTVLIAVKGIRVEHAAEPGPFCVGRGETYIKNTVSGINIKKTFNVPGTTTRFTRLFTGEINYASKGNDILRATVYDDTIPSEEVFVYDVESNDHALTWHRVSENRSNEKLCSEDVFFDEVNNIIIKTEMEFLEGANPADGCFNIDKYQTVSKISVDSGKTWTSEQNLDKNIISFRIHKLDTDNYILPCAKTRKEGNGFHQDIEIYEGKFNRKKSILKWKKTSSISVSPEESDCGLSEPHVTSFANGKMIMLLRMGAVIPSQNSRGSASVKFYCVSEDKGKTWTTPAPLTYDNGEYIYSPRCYQDIFRSAKNGKVYAIFNICDRPTLGCDPRNQLHIMEIDEKTINVKRKTVSVIEQKHPEAHNLVRYSNWIMFESRDTLNPVILMRTHMSQFCPARYGMDLSSYRYEIELPN